MSVLKSIVPKEMRDINRTAILEYVRQNGIVSRSAIASDLNLNLSTIVRIIDELMEDKLLRMSGEFEFSGGRRRPLIEIDNSHNVIISVGIGGTKASVALCDILGNILEIKTINNHQCTGESCIKLVESLIDDMFPFVENRILRGISVGVPGVVRDSKVLAAPSVGWDNLPLGIYLQEKYPYPILVENDVNLEALGELWFGHGRTSSNLIYIHIGTGIGMGIILDRCILRGAHNGAGELGYGMFDRSDLLHRYPGFGALESTIGGYGLGERAKEILKDSLNTEELAAITARDVFRYAELNAPWAVNMVEEFIDKLSMALVNVNTLFDPDLIVLGGGVMKSGNNYMEQILNKVTDKTPNPIFMKSSELEQPVILGGCAGIQQRILKYCVVKDTL